MKKKNVTIESLALMVQKGFEETAKKFDVDKRFEKVDERLSGIDRKLDEVDTRLYNIEKNMDNMEKDIAEIKRNFISRSEFEMLSDRVKVLEKRFSAKLK